MVKDVQKTSKILDALCDSGVDCTSRIEEEIMEHWNDLEDLVSERDS